MPKTVVITGGCGFIGHHVVEHFHNKTDWNIIVLDKLSYASKGLDRLRDTDILNDARVKLFTSDLILPLSEGVLAEIGTDINYIVHMAAETHVDNSIKDPKEFLLNNIGSTFNMLERMRCLGRRWVIHCSRNGIPTGPRIPTLLQSLLPSRYVSPTRTPTRSHS